MDGYMIVGAVFASDRLSRVVGFILNLLTADFGRSVSDLPLNGGEPSFFL